MASRLFDGLHIIGELLDVDGPCGGYNLHFAFAGRAGRREGDCRLTLDFRRNTMLRLHNIKLPLSYSGQSLAQAAAKGARRLSERRRALRNQQKERRCAQKKRRLLRRRARCDAQKSAG